MSATLDLNSLTQAAINFSISAIILAGLTALFLQAIYDLGIRSLFQYRWVQKWKSLLSKDSAIMADIINSFLIQRRKGHDAFSLSYQQLCGQIAVAIQNELTASKASPKQRQALAVQLERQLDDLQIYLGKQWRLYNYLLNFAVSIFIMLLLLWTNNQFNAPFGQTTWLLLFVGAAAGLLAPVVRNLLDRIASGK